LKRFSLISILVLIAVMLIPCISGCVNEEKVNMPIVLYTDFGNKDYRVPQLKGIIFNSNPGARLVDATQDIPAFDIATGAFIMDISAREFPENVVFISVVAPYAQDEIKYLVLTNTRNQYFVLPDNGLLTHVVNNTGIKDIYQITNQKLFDSPIPELSAEKIQGTIGALISNGYQPEDVGIPLANPVILDIQKPEVVDNKLLGTVIYVDHFGNGVTNISETVINQFGIKLGDMINVKISQDMITMNFGTNYSDVPQGDEIAFVNVNLDLFQLSINLGDFADRYDIKAGMKIEVEK
jgi:S-adenosylmethionine hydrolase